MKSILIPLAFLVAIVAPQLVRAEEQTMCTQQYQPVCGAQQVQCFAAPCYPMYHTYGNSCTLGAEKGTYIHDGECTEKESGPIKPTEPYKPPASCIAWFDGCNSCSKRPNGQSICTMRACMNEPTPGYCTAYEKPAPVVAPVEVAATTTATSTEATTTAEHTPSRIIQIWNSLISWILSFF
ncbi:MAG: hypothetical protein JWN64_176 [Parcubacteria group bacterium]|nr:hypothetical protein [Parcubacteria group bacterium]